MIYWTWKWWMEYFNYDKSSKNCPFQNLVDIKYCCKIQVVNLSWNIVYVVVVFVIVAYCVESDQEDFVGVSYRVCTACQWNCFTLNPSLTAIVLYANSLNPDETLSNWASQPDPSCLTLKQHFHQFWATFKHFESWSRREFKQTTIY